MMTKKDSLFIVLFSIILCNYHLAQNNDANLLFKNQVKLNDIGFVVAPGFAITKMDGSTASLFSLHGGLSLNDKVSFGAYFRSSLNQIKPQSETIQNIYLDYWTTGGFFDYTMFSKKAVHLNFPVFFGYGEVEMDNDFGNAGLGEAHFFQLEPAVNLELNLHQYMRFNIGAGYRIVGQMNYRNFNQSDISGLNMYLGLKFGLFR